MKREAPESAVGNKDRYLVPGLVRGLILLKNFTPERPVMTLSEFAEVLGITRSAAFRTAYTLTEMGCLLHDERSQTYSIGPGVLRLTYGYVAAKEVAEIAQPELERLQARTNWSAHMGILDGTSVLYVLRVAASPADTSIVHVGRRLPARSTTMGRVLLASMPKEKLIEMFRVDSDGAKTGKGPSLPRLLAQAEIDRKTKVVIHSGDFEASIASAAAPLRDVSGKVVAAINLTHPNGPDAVKSLNSTVRKELIATANRISMRLGYEASI